LSDIIVLDGVDMQQYGYTAINYVAPSGVKPVEEFIYGPQRTDEDRRKIFAVIIKLQTDGPRISRMFSEQLRGKIYELKIRTPRTLVRILYAWLPGKKALFLHAIEKDTPKTPAGDIRIAEDRLKDYHKRINKKENS
jgi:phage-related protein